MAKSDVSTGSDISGTLPLYADAQVVRADRHGARGIMVGGEAFNFAGKAPLVPVTVDEFERAALDYPLILVGVERRAFAVTGVTPDSNLFVQPDGSYALGAYIPAYLRRYPFVFARTPDGNHRVLCVDEASERVMDAGATDAQPLFVDGQPSDLTRQAVSFCQTFEAAENRTATFTALLDEMDLLEAREARMTRLGEEGQQENELLIAYVAPSADKIARLDDDNVLRLHKAGALAPLFAMSQSAANWDALGVLNAHRVIEAGADERAATKAKSK